MQLKHFSKTLPRSEHIVRLRSVLHLALSLAAIGISALVATPAAAQSNSLDSLPETTQEEISRVCLPVQYREGACAYRNCVQTELSLRNSNGNDGTSKLANLSFDDKYAVQQACAKAGGQSSADYQTCVTTQITELNDIEKPSLQLISEDELYVVQQSCFDAQSKQGAASYRRCLNGEVNSLLAIPAADTSNLSMLKKNALQLRCSSNSSTAVQYRQCVASEFESIAGRTPSFLPVSTAAAVARPDNSQKTASVVNETVEKVAELKQAKPAETAAAPQVVINEVQPEPTMALPRNITPPNTQTSLLDAEVSPTTNEAPVDATEETIVVAQNDVVAPTDAAQDSNARVISRPELVKTLQEQAQAKAQGIEPETSVDATATAAAGGTDIMSKVSGLWQKFLNALSSLDSTGWLIIAGVLALPALLLGLFSFTRRIRNSADLPEVSNHALAERIEPGLQTRKLRHEKEAASLFDDESSTAQHSDHDAVTRMATKSERSGNAQAPIPTETPSEHSTNEQYARAGQSSNPAMAAQSGWQSAFGPWLQQLPEADQQSACIEFLIYWVAYGDDRYEPELKKRLFTATDLSSHDEIKRWVLKQDVFAFSDVIVWLRENASQKQLGQTIGLIWALLVTENSVTPVQNTLIRFLSDAFGVGMERIEKRFGNAFGHPLPSMPRTDNLTWWAKQNDTQVQNWNSRALAVRPEKEQMLARLGLSFDYDDAQVISAFRRAARRCHPDRFGALAERERALAEQRLIKFEEARDKLLGVSV